MKLVTTFFLFIIFTSVDSNCCADLEGRYYDKNCEITLEIFKRRYQIEYRLITQTRNEGGIIVVGLPDDDNGYYLTLSESLMSEAATCSDIKNLGMYFIGDSITMQNYGNSLCEYVRLNDCDSKLITLKKIKNHR